MISRNWILAAAAAAIIGIIIAETMRGGRPRGDAGPGAAPPASLLQQERAGTIVVDLENIGHVQGAADAPVEVIEFSDFGCPFCGQFARRTYPVLYEEFIETGRVRWRFVPFVMGIFPNGEEAARAAECAAEQGEDAFWAMHDLLYERQAEWKSTRNPESLFNQLAAELRLDESRFATCYAEYRSRDRVAAHNALAAQAAVRATPTFFINGVRAQGALPVEQFRMILNEFLR